MVEMTVHLEDAPDILVFDANSRVLHRHLKPVISLPNSDAHFTSKGVLESVPGNAEQYLSHPPGIAQNLGKLLWNLEHELKPSGARMRQDRLRNECKDRRQINHLILHVQPAG